MARKAAEVVAAGDAILAEAEQLEAAGYRAEASLLRRTATRTDPALFALVYLSRSLSDERGLVSLSTVHLAWAKSARAWAKPLGKPASQRRAEVAPRETGKSTWHFLILPMWAAAHGHRRFAAAFADSDLQAQTHLATFKRELDTNRLLRLDFPDLVVPRTRGRGIVEADRVSLYHAKSGFVFAAAGMDSSNLGMKVGDQRPDLIVLDDIEPHEARYSGDLATKRLNTLRQAILPLNIRATVIIVGTVTMHGSIVHQLVQASRGSVEPELKWVAEERIKVRHTLPIVDRGDGTRVSIWPEKWPLDFLESIEHTRQYALNYANDPIGADGAYWSADDFVRKADPLARQILLSVDPAVSTSKKSDPTGFAVIAHHPPARRSADATTAPVGRCVVLHAEARRLTPTAQRDRVLALVEQYGVGVVLVETNQGGDLWRSILHDVPAKLRTVKQVASKEARASEVLNLYQRGRVWHDPEADLSAAEGQMVTFPRAAHDDMVDAIGSGVAYFLTRKRPTKAGARAASYV